MSTLRSQEERPVFLTSAQSSAQTAMLCEILKDAGIPVFVKPHADGVMEAYAGAMISGGDLYVRGEDLAAARDAIAFSPPND